MKLAGLAAVVGLAGVPGPPELRYDRAERHFATTVDGFLRGEDPDAPTSGAPDAVYVRRSGRHVQFWLWFTSNPQDRGIVRTGRHEGDWEVAQVTLGAGGRPVRVTVSQHSWAETCAVADGRVGPLHVASASHALYLTAGEHGRPWPDPDDQADGRGRRVRPRALPFDRRILERRERWGATRAGIVPGESDSPLSPHLQDASWDPERFLARARDCGSGAPYRPYAPVLLGTVGLLILSAVRRRRRSRGQEREGVTRRRR